MEPFMITLGWAGIFAPLALGAIGSMVGTGQNFKIVRMLAMIQNHRLVKFAKFIHQEISLLLINQSLTILVTSSRVASWVIVSSTSLAKPLTIRA